MADPMPSPSRRLRVLAACEESQAVTAAFRALGHFAMSCDLLPASGGHPEWHLQRDVLALLDKPWDLVVAFPPCTHLATSGARHFAQKRADGRQQAGIDFFLAFTKLGCAWSIENPVGIMSTVFRKPDQIIQPWMFGYPTTKATCLWLHGLPKLVPTDVVDKGEIVTLGSGARMSRFHYDTSCLPQKDRAHARSKTFPGVALAMADQWSRHLLSARPE